MRPVAGGSLAHVIWTVSPAIATAVIATRVLPDHTSNPRPGAHSLLPDWCGIGSVVSHANGDTGTWNVTVITRAVRVTLTGSSGRQSRPSITRSANTCPVFSPRRS